MDAERAQKMEFRRAMALAINDIEQLRRTNQLLSAKVEVVELFAALVMPRQSTGMAEDSVWLLRRALESLDPPKGDEATE